MQCGDGGVEAARLRVRGVVQGVGFRPFVYALAQEHHLAGWVRNTSAGVEIHVEGTPAALNDFAAALPRQAPPRAIVTECVREAADVSAAATFVILESAADPDAYQLVSPDLATCAACRRELFDPCDRRYQYPFTNCTDCGPRFSIIESLPYDRERTTMRVFPLCPACRREYEDPANRRFHAEPNACPVCGPRLRLVRRLGDGEATQELRVGTTEDPAGPLQTAAELLCAGEILAVKGLGGFHLACLARDGAAVRRLKKRKGRPHKPLAVMFADVAAVRRCCVVGVAEAALLESPEHPIVLLPWRAAAAAVVDGVNPDATGDVHPEVALGQCRLGAMLPYTPLHLLLLHAVGAPVVMTSGNIADEPLARDEREAERLAAVADAFLLHDRPIAQRCDDSVAIVSGGRVNVLRRARGYAPLPVRLPRRLPQVLACGAEVKNAFCLTREHDAFVSQHVGDLENLETLEHFEESVTWYRRLFAIEPEVIAHDLHPEYLATKYALAQSTAKVAVQHHHAHVAASMVEAGLEDPVIGVCLDGLGYGDDGGLWGGEVLLCDFVGYRRVASLELMPLPGGAAAIRAPWRTAAGWALAALGDEGFVRAGRLLSRASEPPIAEELQAVRRQVETGTNAPATTSCGRLFDAVSALAGVRSRVTYEGQAAIELEAAASVTTVAGAGGLADMAGRPVSPYPVVISGDIGAAAEGPLQQATEWMASRAGRGATAASVTLRLAPLFSAVLDDLEDGTVAGVVGARLHVALATFACQVCTEAVRTTGVSTVVLSGGVFQNELLSALCARELEAAGIGVVRGGLVPCNDGGVALGQAAVGGYTLLYQRGEYSPPGR